MYGGECKSLRNIQNFPTVLLVYTWYQSRSLSIGLELTLNCENSLAQKNSSSLPITYPSWEQSDQLVFTWLIDNINDNLVNNVSKYSTAKALWDGLAVTYGSGGDLLQIFDLHKQCYTVKQGNRPLESLWDQFQGLWMTIDSIDPNPMESPKDIAIYSKKIQEQSYTRHKEGDLEERSKTHRRNGV